MKAGGPLRRGKPLGRHREMKRTPFRTALAVFKPSRPQPAVPPSVRAALKKRSGGLCEVQLLGCSLQGTDASHRITTKAGGRHGAAKVEHDRLSDVTYACRPCHRWIGAEPALAKALGLALEEWQDPTAVPVLLLLHDPLPIFLTDDGGVVRSEEGT